MRAWLHEDKFVCMCGRVVVCVCRISTGIVCEFARYGMGHDGMMEYLRGVMEKRVMSRL